MKIAHVVTLKESVPPQSQNGLEFLVSWLVDELVNRGHEVTLFASADSKTKAKLVPILPKATNRDITELGQPYFSILNTVFAGSKAEEFDIIHCHDFFGSLILPFINTPVVQTIHHPYRDEFLPQYLKEPAYKETLKFVTDQYAKINYVPISKKQEEFFKQSEQDYFKKYHTIHNGIPVEQFPFNAKPKEYLFYIGYINKDKGADIAVQVARKAGMKLILAGNNYKEEAFFKEHIEPYLDENIQYFGPANFEQKTELYKNALATIVPLHWHEPFGLTFVESQACGTPVIAFDKGASRELIKEGKTGFVVDTEDQMVDAVKKIDQLSREECRAWVEENFSIKKMVDEYEKHYQAVLDQHKK